MSFFFHFFSFPSKDVRGEGKPSFDDIIFKRRVKLSFVVFQSLKRKTKKSENSLSLFWCIYIRGLRNNLDTFPKISWPNCVILRRGEGIRVEVRIQREALESLLSKKVIYKKVYISIYNTISEVYAFFLSLSLGNEENKSFYSTIINIGNMIWQLRQ